MKPRKDRVMTLQDGTEVREGDKVCAQGEDGVWRRCFVLEILGGTGVDKAILTSRLDDDRWIKSKHGVFGTVIRSRYQIRALKNHGSRS
jgi:hypothetical protein